MVDALKVRVSKVSWLQLQRNQKEFKQWQLIYEIYKSNNTEVRENNDLFFRLVNKKIKNVLISLFTGDYNKWIFVHQFQSRKCKIWTSGLDGEQKLKEQLNSEISQAKSLETPSNFWSKFQVCISRQFLCR